MSNAVYHPPSKTSDGESHEGYYRIIRHSNNNKRGSTPYDKDILTKCTMKENLFLAHLICRPPSKKMSKQINKN